MNKEIEAILKESEKKFLAKPISVEHIYLVREPLLSTKNRLIYRFARSIKGQKLEFLYNQRHCTFETAASLIPEKDQFICQYYNEEGEVLHAIASQNLLHFCACDEVETYEIYKDGAYLPQLRERTKTLQKMKESLFGILGREFVTVGELLSYERQLVCIQQKGAKREKIAYDEFFGDHKK